MTNDERLSLRARPYYDPETHTLGVELLLDREPFAVIGLGEATALGTELIRMAAYAENECQLDLSYEMLGNDLAKRKLLLSMQKTSRKVYFGELTGEVQIGGEASEEDAWAYTPENLEKIERAEAELSSQEEGNDARREA